MFGQLYDDQLCQLSIGRRLDVASTVYTKPYLIQQSGRLPMMSAVIIIQGVGVEAYTLLTKDQTVGWPGGQYDYCGHYCINRRNLHTSQGLRRCAASFRVWGNILHDLGNMQCPNPWCFILNQLKNFKINTYKADGGYNCPVKMETLGKTTGNENVLLNKVN